MARAMKICSCLGCQAHTGSCPEIVPTGRCERCGITAERRRGTATARGYGGPGHDAFRRDVLRRDRICKMPGCDKWATDADHYPIARDALVLKGQDPNDPAHGRGLCDRHHKQETALNQPGGWNRR